MVQCRIYYLGIFVVLEFKVYCLYGVVDGGGVCIVLLFICGVYCEMILNNCSGDNV